MPRIFVILKDGHTVTVEGANDARWSDTDQRKTFSPDKAAVLEVFYKDGNTEKVYARFDPKATAGYIIDSNP